MIRNIATGFNYLSSILYDEVLFMLICSLACPLDRDSDYWRSIESFLIGFNDVEVVWVFVVVLEGKEGKEVKWGGNVWGKEKFLQESLQMWGKCGENWEIENR